MDIHIETPEKDRYPVGFPENLPLQTLLAEFLASEDIKIHPRQVVAWDVEDEAGQRKLDLKKSLEHNGVRNGHRLRLVRATRDEGEPHNPPKSGDGLKRCENGHYFDASRYQVCPFDVAPKMDPGSTSIRIGPAGGGNGGHTVPYGQGGRGRTEQEGDPATIRVGQGGNIDAVVGWLVCVHGKNRGRDYRIRSENNTVGRSEKMDICISGDDLISRERHTVITFDPQQNAFHLSPADGRGLVFLNNKAVLIPQELKPFDEIVMGATKLCFVPFCGEKFKWS